MVGAAFDTFTPHAAGAVSRRASLLIAAGAALSAAAMPSVATAGKAGKKARKKCKKQKGQCRSAIEEICDGSQACLNVALPCCAHLARCRAGAALRCIFS